MNKEIIKLTEKEFRDIIMESVNKILKEGIVVDTYDNVTMTDKHEKLVDTSVENNPTLLKDFVKELTPARVFALLFIGATLAIVKAIYSYGVAAKNYVK